MNSIAHIRESDDCVQTLEDHLIEVKKLSELIGRKIGVKHIAGLAGVLHDLGKYSPEFIDYILKAVYEPEVAPSKGSVDHSTAGGKLIFNLLHEDSSQDVWKKLLAEIVGNAIISHHLYLHDYLSLELTSPFLNRVKNKKIDNFNLMKEMFFKNVMNVEDFKIYISKALKELKEFVEKDKNFNFESKIMFLTKFVFSALIDADRTNTRQFVEDEQEIEEINTKQLFNNYYDKLMKKLKTLSKNDSSNKPINILRKDMSQQCEDFASKPSGIYTLSIPTGGGKTLSSLRYALKHAIKYNKKRIIYVIPYTSIIEQNAAVVREIFGDNSLVLEHHSNAVKDDNYVEQDIYTSDVKKKLILAKDSWDSPVIFTTMVQYLNVFYTDKSRDVRRLHNLADSVIIFDEVQKVPVNCVSLFNESLNFLKRYCNSSIVLCTATQPALDFVQHKLDINTNAEMIKNIDNVFEQFKRVNIIDLATDSQYNQEMLIDFIDKKLCEVKNILVILNTKTVVRKLFKELKNKLVDDILIYHLSTSMCPVHRSDILNEIKEHLTNKKPLVCISTQLVEAGVDISFECVIRSLAGLDSIAQAAGRCNRNGEMKSGNVYIIDYIEENLINLNEISQGKAITKKILKDIQLNPNLHGKDLLSLKAMKYYFLNFYKDNEVNLDYPIRGTNHTMAELLMANLRGNSLYREYRSRNSTELITHLVINNSYRTAAKNFQVIDNPTTSVIVPYDEGRDIIAELNGDINRIDFTKFFTKVQRYSVNVYSYELEQLKQSNGLITLMDNEIYALKEGAYDKEYGINIEGDSEQDLLAF